MEGRTIAHATPAELAFDLGSHAVLMHGWFGSVAGSIIGPLWTLSHEWIFYLLIGATAPLLRSRFGWSVPGGMLVLSLLAKYLVVAGQWHPTTDRNNPICLWDQFAFGLLGAQLSLTCSLWKHRSLCVWSAALVGVLLVGWCVYSQLDAATALTAKHVASNKVVSVKAFANEFSDAFYKRKSNVLWFPCLFACGVALLLVAATTGFQRLNAFIKRTPLPWMGKVSYSTYLYHMAVVLCLMRGFREIPDGGLFKIQGAAVVVALIGVYSVSAFGYHFFEKPWLARRTASAA